MIYNGKNLETIGQVFEMALYYAQNNDVLEGHKFMEAYVNRIKEDNPGMTYEECTDRAKANLGYFAGYWSTDVQNLMRNFYNTYHPIFG